MGDLLYHERYGTGPVLVFLHGFSLDRRMWQPQLDAFAAHHSVLLYDLRGFGRSPLPDGEYSHVDDLLTLMDHLQIESAALIGLSRGGGVAINFTLAHPGRVNHLVAVDSVLDGHRWSDSQRSADQAVWDCAKRDGLEAGKAAWLAHPLFVAPFRQASVKAAAAQMVADYSGWHFFNRDPVRSLKPYAIERLHEITCPTLTIVGEEDLIDFQQIADSLSSKVPNGRKVVLPNVGHLSNMEAPESFNQVVLKFLETGE
ncbi:MAG: alpha/beta hydrolase [Caldilineaceae bacterium]